MAEMRSLLDISPGYLQCHLCPFMSKHTTRYTLLNQYLSYLLFLKVLVNFVSDVMVIDNWSVSNSSKASAVYYMFDINGTAWQFA